MVVIMLLLHKMLDKLIKACTILREEEHLEKVKYGKQYVNIFISLLKKFNFAHTFTKSKYLRKNKSFL